VRDYRSLEEVQADISQGVISLPKLVQHYLDQIAEKDELNIFLEVFSEEALERASAIQNKIENNSAGKLAGMVIAIKDNILYAGHKVSAASKILEGFESLYSATAVERLLREDAIIIGRVNCDEFAMGGSNENSAFGNVKNPVDQDYVPGGSSGGSAAAVAAGLCLAALGSDTGGSIRQPASFCGVVGVKPTYGRISRHGLIAFGSSFDQIGPLTHSVKDAALLTEIMSGKDEMDTTSSSNPDTSYLPFAEEQIPKKIGYIQEALESDSIDLEVKNRMLAFIESLKEEGHTLEPVHLEELKYLVPAYYMLTTAEASSNLARYDGIHYGRRSENSTDIESTYTESRTEGFGPEVKRRILLGTFVLSAGYYDSYYAKAQKVRNKIKMKTEELFKSYDFLLSPTTPSTAFKFGENMDDPIKMYLEDLFTVHANLVGMPAISLPLGKSATNSLPFGLQFMAPPFQEKSLFELSHNLMHKAALKA